jgi:hypothetical protein
MECLQKMVAKLGGSFRSTEFYKKNGDFQKLSENLYVTTLRIIQFTTKHLSKH